MTSFPRDPTANTQAAHQSRVSAARKRASRRTEFQLGGCSHESTTTTPGTLDGVNFEETKCDNCDLSLGVKRT